VLLNILKAFFANNFFANLQGLTNSGFFRDLAQKLGKNVETNIIVGYKFFELWGHKVAKFFYF
jgi:hypothetical protein